MTFALSDLAALRGIEGHATYAESVRSRIQELDTEFSGKPLDDEAREEWADLRAISAKVDAALTELRARAKDLERFNALPGHAERQADYAVPNVRNSSQSRVPENIFDTAEYRSRSSGEQLEQAYRDGAMFAVERATYPNPQSVASVEQEHIGKLLDTIDTPDKKLARRVLATGSPVYARAFNKLVLGQALTAEEQRYTNVLAQTDAQGGYALPFFFDPTLLHVGAWTTVNPFRSACTTKQIVGTDTYHGVSATAVLASRADEADAAVESGPATWGQIEIIVKRVQALVTLSVEMLQDRPDITSEVASLLAEAKDTEEEHEFAVGAGTTFHSVGMMPAYNTSGAYTTKQTATTTTLAIGDAYAWEADLPIRHRPNAAWFMSRATIRAFQALENANGQLFGGQYYSATPYPSRPNPTGNTGLRLLDYPIWEVPSATTGLGAHTVVGAFCNPSTYYIVDRIGMNVEVIPHIFGAGQGNLPTGQRGIYAIWRNGAKPATTDGGRLLEIKN